MIIDMHCSLVPSAEDPAAEGLARLPHTRFDPATCTVDATLARMDKTGVDQTVVWCLGRSLEACRRYNDFIADVARAHPERFIPFATAHPEAGDDAVAELHRAVEELGMRGLKLHPDVFEISIDDPRFLSLVETARHLEVPFVTHVHPTLIAELEGTDPDADVDDPIRTTPRPTYSAAKLVPALVGTWDSPRVQLAHMGAVTRPDIQASTLTFQTTGVSTEVIRFALETVGSHRIVFGSDYPFFAVEGELAKITGLGLDDDETRMLLGENALERVLGVEQA